MGARMLRKGLAVAVILLFIGVAFAPSINANVSKSYLDISVEEDATPTPIVLVLQLIAKLRNHPNIQNVETEDDVLRIIEDDKELNAIVEKLKSFDCGCEDDYKPELERRRWFIVCTFLIPIWIFSVILTFGTGVGTLEDIVYAISEIFNCGFS